MWHMTKLPLVALEDVDRLKGYYGLSAKGIDLGSLGYLDSRGS